MHLFVYVLPIALSNLLNCYKNLKEKLTKIQYESKPKMLTILLNKSIYKKKLRKKINTKSKKALLIEMVANKC